MLATRAENQIKEHDRTVHVHVHPVNTILLVGVENLRRMFVALAWQLMLRSSMEF